MFSYSAEEYYYVDVTNLHCLPDSAHKALIDFLSQSSTGFFTNHLKYNHIYNNKKYIYYFSHEIVKNNQKYYVKSHVDLGRGSFGSVTEGLGTLQVRGNRLVLNQVMHCDFIYASSQSAWSIDYLVSHIKSKTAYVLIGNSLFYVDKTTHRPRTALDYVKDLSDHEVQSLIAQYAFTSDNSAVQCKIKLKEEVGVFSNYHTQQSQKNFLLKYQAVRTYQDRKTIQNEASCANKLSSELGKTKGPFFYADLSGTCRSVLKIDKKQGSTLAEILDNDRSGKRKLTIHERVLLTLALFNAVEIVHQKGKVIHRDLKPENFIVDLGTDKVFAIDFGFAKPAGSKVYESVGTPLYCSPEGLNDLHTDEKSDSYSLGKLIAEVWGLQQSQLSMLSSDPYLQVAEFSELMRCEDVGFSRNYAVDDPDNILSRLLPILLKMSKLNPKHRYDLEKAKKLFCDIPSVKLILAPEIRFISNEKTRKKITEVITKNENPLYFTKPNCFKDLENWQVHTVNTTSLHAAILEHSMPLVTSLLNAGVDVNQPNCLDSSPLSDIIKFNSISLKNHFIYSVDSLFYKGTKQFFTPLHAAVCFGDEKMVALLLSAKANPFILAEGLSSLDMAYTLNKPEIYKILYASLSVEEKKIEDLRFILMTIIEKMSESEFSDKGRMLAFDSLSSKLSAIIAMVKDVLKDFSLIHGVYSQVFCKISNICQKNRIATALFKTQEEIILDKLFKLLPKSNVRSEFGLRV